MQTPDSRPTEDQPLPDADLREAVHTFFPEARAVEPVPGHDDLGRVETDAGAWRLRRWPPATTEARLQSTHAAMRLARELGVDFVPDVAALPDGGAILTRDGRRYDAWRWQPGAPVERATALAPADDRRVDLPAILPDAAFAAAIGTIARMHAASQSETRPAAVAELPLAGLPTVVRQAWGAQRSVLRPLAPALPPVQRWLATGERVLPAAEQALAAVSVADMGEALTHLGLWPAHLLLEGDRLGGLLGWESAAWSSPLLDLAQAIVRLRGWTAASVETALAAYGDQAPLSGEARRLLPAVAALDLVPSAGSLLVAAYGSGAVAPPSALRVGIRSLLASLDVAAGALAQATAKRKPAPARAARTAGRDRPERSGQGTRPRRGAGERPTRRERDRRHP
jgi:Phosphotransferase enzyme family